VAAGIILLGETLTLNEPLGAAIIIVGALLVQGRLRPLRRQRVQPDSMPA
jgi:drug/metabolite transporter (DMT)-like permease